MSDPQAVITWSEDGDQILTSMAEQGIVLVERQPLADLVGLINSGIEIEIQPDEDSHPKEFGAELTFNIEELRRLRSILVYLTEVLK